MGEVFYADYTKQIQQGNTTAWGMWFVLAFWSSEADFLAALADITQQFILMFQNTIQNVNAPNYTGLLYHGYDFSHQALWASPDRGHSPEVWDRALGWYSMALVDVLEIFPRENPGYQNILTILRTLVPRIRDAAEPTSGVWWLVITQPGRAKNYFESSGSAMFVYAMLKALRLGYVQDTVDRSILRAARKAYDYMIQNWVVPNSDGTMNWLNTVNVSSAQTWVYKLLLHLFHLFTGWQPGYNGRFRCESLIVS